MRFTPCGVGYRNSLASRSGRRGLHQSTRITRRIPRREKSSIGAFPTTGLMAAVRATMAHAVTLGQACRMHGVAVQPLVEELCALARAVEDGAQRAHAA